MKPKDIKKVLDSMVLLVDTREQDTPRMRNRLQGIPYRRATLDFGDYTYNAQLPSGEWIYNESAPRIFPAFSLERKMDLDELAQCFTRSRERFEAEFERAQSKNAGLWLLVENASWDKVHRHQYRTQMPVSAFLGSVFAFQTRYHAQLYLWPHWDSGKMIWDILHWQLQERLKGGDYG